MEKTYTMAEAANLLGVSYTRVWQVINAGHLKTHRVGVTKRFVRISEKDLKKYAELAGKQLKEVVQ